MRKARGGLISVEANAAMPRYAATKTNRRFWIITMMLVLVGLSTLKLR
jgi:hypothetical protein